MIQPASLSEISVIPVTDVLAWVVIGVFVVGALFEYRGNRELSRRVTVAAWGLFSLFWLLLIQHFVYVHRSVIQAVLTIIAVPACLYVGYHLLAGRDSLLVLSRAVAVMGIIYLPFEMSSFAAGILIETVARQTTTAIELLGYGSGMELTEDPSGENAGLMSVFWFPETGRSSRIVLACTGIGSMAIFGGLIAAVKAPLRQKLKAFGVAVGVIWILNIGRNVFIALANGHQWFAGSMLEGPVMFAFGLSDPARVSFFLADRVISQGLAIFALVGIAWIVTRWVPEILDVAEDLLFLLTGDEISLRQPAVADGGERPDEP
ncbi:MAG: archaeosortase A [Natronomonas sp.]